MSRKTTQKTLTCFLLVCSRNDSCEPVQVKKFFVPSKENVGATHKEQRQCTEYEEEPVPSTGSKPVDNRLPNQEGKQTSR